MPQNHVLHVHVSKYYNRFKRNTSVNVSVSRIEEGNNERVSDSSRMTSNYLTNSKRKPWMKMRRGIKTNQTCNLHKCRKQGIEYQTTMVINKHP